MNKAIIAVLVLGFTAVMYGCSANVTDAVIMTEKENETESVVSGETTVPVTESTEMTDEEFATLQVVFAKALEGNSDFDNELKYKPAYIGAWNGGKRYHTENYAYGQFVFDMDIDGYPHTITWQQDHAETWDGKVKRQGGTLVVYNRLEDPDAPAFETANDGAIHIVDGELGEYGKEVTVPSKTYGEYTYVWYKIPNGTYTVTNEGNRSTVFLIGDASSEDVRDTIYFTQNGETATITIDEDAHIETSSGTRIALRLVK